MTIGVAIFCVVIVVYAAFAAKLDRWSITAPMVFVAAGYLLGTGGTGLMGISPQAESIKELTEITLALLLFADASTLSLKQVSDDANLPLRLLTIGLILTDRLRGSRCSRPAAWGRTGLRRPAGGDPCTDRCCAWLADLQQPPRARSHPAR